MKTDLANIVSQTNALEEEKEKIEIQTRKNLKLFCAAMVLWPMLLAALIIYAMQQRKINHQVFDPLFYGLLASFLVLRISFSCFMSNQAKKMKAIKEQTESLNLQISNPGSSFSAFKTVLANEMQPLLEVKNNTA